MKNFPRNCWQPPSRRATLSKRNTSCTRWLKPTEPTPTTAGGRLKVQVFLQVDRLDKWRVEHKELGRFSHAFVAQRAVVNGKRQVLWKDFAVKCFGNWTWLTVTFCIMYNKQSCLIALLIETINTLNWITENLQRFIRTNTFAKKCTTKHKKKWNWVK